MINKIKAVILDLDGTLLNDEKRVGEKDIETLHKIGGMNILRIVATGRSLQSTLDVLDTDFPIDYLVFAAGAGTMNFHTKEIIDSYFFLQEETKSISQKLIDLKVDFQVRAKIPKSHKYFYKRFFTENADFDRLNSIYKKHIRKLKKNNDLGESTRFIIIAPNDFIVEIIQNEFSEYSVIRATSPIDRKSVWMEIYPKNVNKLKVENILKEKNIEFSASLGLGNDYNDIDFLNKTKYSFVTQNAKPELHKMYNITVSNNENPLTALFGLNNNKL